MNKNKQLLLWSSVGVLVLLFYAAYDENFLKQWRGIQSSARAAEGPVDVRLRQVVNPSLRVSDRCVSCHVGMAPGETGITGPQVVSAHKPLPHQPAEFGCTVCHGGQGMATEKDAAHGNVKFWPEPMLPVKYSEAGCGTCHVPLKVPNLPTLARGRDTFERLDCMACHRTDSRGGTLRPGGGGLEGPDLSHVGFKGFNRAWYDHHLALHDAATDGPWRNSFGKIEDHDRAALEAFLDTRTGAPRLLEAKATFNTLGCYGCHKVSGFGGEIGPDLSRGGEKDPGQMSFANVRGEHTPAAWHAAHFHSPPSIVPGSQMPIMGLNDQQIDLLTLYVFSLRRRELPGDYLPKDRVQAVRFGEREFAADGAHVYSAVCSGCHGPEGRGTRYPNSQPFPSLANPDFLEVASDDFIRTTILKGRPGRKMLAWGEKDGGLRPAEIDAVVGYLRQLGGGAAHKPDDKPPRWIQADAGAGRILFSANCAGCHGARGEGGEGPALNNKVLLAAGTDSYFVNTISRGRRGTVMPSFLTPTPARQALTQREIEAIVAFLRTWEAR